MRSEHAWFSVLSTGPVPAAQRLYCFPYAGAGHTVCQHWRELLPAGIELALIKLPGRGARFNEPLEGSLQALADALAEAIASAQAAPEAPAQFALFGHSMGALLAFETARRLQARGDSPAVLFVSARTAPAQHGWRGRVSDLPAEQFLAVLRGMNGLPAELLANPEWLDFFLPILRADFALCEDYRYRPDAPLDCPIHVLAGERDDSVPRELLRGWAEEGQHGCNTWLFPGGHFYLFEHERPVLRLLLAQLHRVQEVAHAPG